MWTRRRKGRTSDRVFTESQNTGGKKNSDTLLFGARRSDVARSWLCTWCCDIAIAAGSNLQYLLTSSEPSQDYQHTQCNKNVLRAKGQSLDTFFARSIVPSSTDCVKQQCQRKKVIVGSAVRSSVRAPTSLYLGLETSVMETGLTFVHPRLSTRMSVEVPPHNARQRNRTP
jgi:hypothetical protein